MSSRKPRWELVRTTAGWHARFRSSNGNIIVASEVYKRRRDAERAINLVVDPIMRAAISGDPSVELRRVDER